MRASGWAVAALLLSCGLAMAQVPGAEGQPSFPQADASSGQDAASGPDPGFLAHRLQSPLASISALLVQERLSFGVGDLHRIRSVTAARGAFPVSLGSRWRLIVRGELPLILEGDPVDPDATYGGFGDSLITGLVTGVQHGVLNVGLGPAMLLPTASSARLGSGKWSAGPTAAVVAQPRPWTVGVQAVQVWSFAGASDRSVVSSLQLRPVLSVDLPRAWYLTSAPLIVADWSAPPGERWLVPVSAGFGKVYSVGPIRFDVQLDASYYVVRPVQGPRWSLSAGFGLLGAGMPEGGH